MTELENHTFRKLPDPPEEVSLPGGWKHTLPKEQHLWVSTTLFTRDPSGKLLLKDPQQLWWSPPEPQQFYSEPPPLPDPFFQSRLFLWMPCRMWEYRLLCTNPNCRRLCNHLRPCGLYNSVRRVLDISGWYFMVTEHLECCSCKKKVASWSQDILDQLDLIHREKFPAVLTYRVSCDKELVRLMRCQKTPGKSALALYQHLRVRHKEQWTAQAAEYLFVLSKFQDLSAVTIRVPEIIPVPCPSLLLAVYAKDLLTRLGEMKARVTSVYGSILKMASIKMITKKHDSAVSLTSMGNENGQLLMCVLTQTESAGLLPMCSGLMERYRQAREPPPQVLYVTQDCCSTTGKSKVQASFHEWDQLVIRLDAWQFMRRFAAGVTSESHPMYGLFMGRLFSCIFEWDAGDLKRLQESKQQELQQSKDTKAFGKLSAKELLKHCRHQTREPRVAKLLIEQLLKEFMGASDIMGNKLLEQEKIEEIWRAQQCHLSCIQDPPGLQLYRKVRDVTRGGLTLPLYHCSRGVGSLESFHQHLNNFIPGRSTHDLHFHVYLLEGMVKWNKARSDAVDEGSPLQDYLNNISQRLLGCKLVEDHKNPGAYTGELIGIEYLYSQTNRVLEVDGIMDPDAPDGSDEQLEGDLEYEDPGLDSFRSPEFLEFSLKPIQHIQFQAALLQSPSSVLLTSQPDPIVSSTSGPIKDEPYITDQITTHCVSQEDDDQKCIGPDSVPGYDHVINLANSLVELLNHGFVTQQKADEVVALWNKLSEHDKGGIVHPAQPVFDNLHTDIFETLCIDGLQSRLVAAICLALSHMHPAGQNIAGVWVNRWAAILRDYNIIRNLVRDSTAISARTRIQLLEINQHTLCQWYNARKQRQEQLILHLCTDSIKASEHLLPVPHIVPEPLQHGSGGDVIKVVIGSPKPPDAMLLQQSSGQRPSANRLPSPKVPRTTAWRRRKAEEKAFRQGIPLKRPCEQYVCKKCGKPKTKEFGHSQFRGVHFCALASGKTVEQWMEEMRLRK